LIGIVEYPSTDCMRNIFYIIIGAKCPTYSITTSAIKKLFYSVRRLVYLFRILLLKKLYKIIDNGILVAQT
jgi:hypothetical protein